jgi:hypothetical protein
MYRANAPKTIYPCKCTHRTVLLLTFYHPRCEIPSILATSGSRAAHTHASFRTSALTHGCSVWWMHKTWGFRDSTVASSMCSRVPYLACGTDDGTDDDDDGISNIGVSRRGGKSPGRRGGKRCRTGKCGNGRSGDGWICGLIDMGKNVNVTQNYK